MKKAVIVMPYGHPVPRQVVRPDSYSDENNAAMERAVLTEILPFVETTYRVSHEPEERAIVGLSMGGGHALGIGLAHPDVFHWVGGFSSSAPSGDLDTKFSPWVRGVKAKKHGPRLLWIGLGREDSLLARNEVFAAWLKQNNVPFTWKLTDGGHEWTLWREYFAEFAQQLFH
jgi:enterochelin esterase family protein